MQRGRKERDGELAREERSRKETKSTGQGGRKRRRTIMRRIEEKEIDGEKKENKPRWGPAKKDVNNKNGKERTIKISREKKKERMYRKGGEKRGKQVKGDEKKTEKKEGKEEPRKRDRKGGN